MKDRSATIAVMTVVRVTEGNASDRTIRLWKIELTPPTRRKQARKSQAMKEVDVFVGPPCRNGCLTNENRERGRDAERDTPKFRDGQWNIWKLKSDDRRINSFIGKIPLASKYVSFPTRHRSLRREAKQALRRQRVKLKMEI